MDDGAFARQLCAWLDPLRLAKLANDYARDPASLEQYGRATREATAFRRAADVGLDRLVRAFLEHFELSPPFTAILPGASQLDLPADGLERLNGLRFSGQATFDDFDASDPPGTVVAFRGRAIEILTIAGPINFLVRFVDQMAGLWSSVERGRAFYEPSFHSELPVYIESVVAGALGFNIRTAFTSGRPGVNHRANGILTMVGSPPFDRAQAVQLWSESWGRDYPPPRPVANESAEIVSSESTDAFVLLNPEAAAEPWRNIEHFRNECSLYSGVERPQARTDGKLLVDSQYGRAFDFVLTEESAVYGFTEDLARISDPSDFGYLRVPYRCVPRIRVGSRAEIETIVAALQTQLPPTGFCLLFRGQSAEFYLGRSPAALRALYGDPQALEPSLPASAVRKGHPLEAVLPEWCFLIRSYLFGLTTMVVQKYGSAVTEDVSRRLHEDRKRLEESLDNHAFAFSLAQHYGLPTMGLDLTNQLDTALFFALHRLVAVEGRQLRAAPLTTGQPVLYLLAFPERFCVEHARARPQVFPQGRPDRQHAWFSHMGWGNRRNQCAEYLVAALYLDPAGDFNPLATAQTLFPDWQNDSFGSLMEVALSQSWASPELKAYLTNLYWVNA